MPRDHREVAELISLSVLEHFPKVETVVALLALCWALNAALKSCDWPAVGRVIEDRLGRDGQGPAERACWLAAGYLVEAERYREDLQGLAEDEDGLKWLARFVSAGRFPKDYTQRFAAADFEPLIAALGAALRRDGLAESAYWSTTDLIATLGADPSAAVTEALEALSRVSDAEPWEPAIADAQERQARKRREHEYRHSDIGHVVRTLDNETPANAGDLAALVFDELKDLCLKIRDGSTSDWRQHWNVDRHNHPDGPKAGGRMPRRGAVRSAGTAWTIGNRRAAGGRLRRGQEVGHPRQLRRIQRSGGDEAKLSTVISGRRSRVS